MRAILTVLSLTLLAGAAVADPPDAAAEEFLVLGDRRVSRVGLRVEVDGRPLGAVWDDALGRVFADLDRDGDGRLSRAEAARAPSALRVRQLGWGYLFAVPTAAPWGELDTDPADGSVSRAEFLAYYRRAGAAGVQVAAGAAPPAALLTDALLKQLDRDKSGAVDRAEWQAAADALRPLDLDDDELIRPGELVSRTPYPGTSGGLLLTPPGPRPSSRLAVDLSLLRLPADPSDTHWVGRWIARRDRQAAGRLTPAASGLQAETAAALDANKDGVLDAAELAAWRRQPADEAVVVRLGKRADGAVEIGRAGRADAISVPLELGDVRLLACVTAGHAPDDFDAAHRLASTRFRAGDADGDGAVSEAEARQSDYAPLRDHLAFADRDGDGRLTHAEWETYLELRAGLAAAQVVVTVLDHGPGLVELLDGDGDGALSVRELRGAWKRLEAAGCVAGNAFDRTRLPRQIRVVVSRGRPRSLLRSPPRTGPEWFRALDRNGDGDVSRREFVGTDEAFRKLDLDGDGLISPGEAARAAKPK